MPPEVWGLVPFDHDYEASSYGRVRRRPGKGSPNGKILHLHEDGRGYLNVTLGKTVKVHQVIASVFLGKAPFPGAELNHKDWNPHNNHYKNLEWVTKSQNIQHSRIKRGENHHSSKLTDDDVKAIKESKESGSVLGERYGVSRQRINQIRAGGGWFHLDVEEGNGDAPSTTPDGSVHNLGVLPTSLPSDVTD